MTLKEELKEALLEMKSDEDLQMHKQLFVATIKSDINTSLVGDESIEYLINQSPVTFQKSNQKCFIFNE